MTGVAIVTGGYRGIGFAISKALSEAGFRVAVLAELPDDDAGVRSAMDLLGDPVRYYRHDLLGVGGIADVIDRVEADFGPVTTLVSNAGVPAKQRGDMLDLAPGNFDLVMGVNLRGAYFLAQDVSRRMIAATDNSYRALVFVTSVSAGMVSIERAEYCMSKAGASMMADLFAVRLAPHGVGVFDLRPGIIATPMTSGIRESYTARIEGGLVPAGRWGQPDDIASVVLPLVEGRMAFATGAKIPVDGGLSISRL